MFFCRAAGCGLSFRLNAALQKHLIQRHSSQPTGQPYGCDACDKKFIKKIYLTHHKLRYHHDTLQRDFVCDVSSPGDAWSPQGKVDRLLKLAMVKT